MKSINMAATLVAAFLLLANHSATAASHQEAPLLGSYNFILEIDGVVYGRFASVTGLGASIEVVEYREGGDPDVVRKIPGRTTFSNITLKRGYIASTDLWDWMKSIIAGDFSARNGSIRLISNNGSEAARFNFVGAWPSKYQLALQASDKTDLAIEELTFTVDSIDLR